MLISEVKRLSVEERLVYWITERESIRLKKEAGKPKPWTDDEILQQYRFCNVRRMDDKVSQWLLKNWYEPYHDHPNMLIACALARQLNNPESLAAIGFPDEWMPRVTYTVLSNRTKRKLKNFSGAYMITGTLGGDKAFQVVWKVVDPLYTSRLYANTDSMQSTWQSLLPFAGFSSFIAGQVTADLRWALSGKWDDCHVWAPLGPGSRRGMNRFQGRWLEQPISDKQFQDELWELMYKLRTRLLPKRITKRLEAIDYQNCLCELDKYCRVLDEQGKPKQRYQGV